MTMARISDFCCPNDGAHIPHLATIGDARFYVFEFCHEIFAYVGENPRYVGGFAWRDSSHSWQIFRVEGNKDDLAIAMSAVEKIGPPDWARKK